jgi:uncharacterized RDD family membrane protein YckC
MQTIRITTAQNIDIDYEIGGLGERIIARLIDYGIFIFIFILGLIFANAADLIRKSGVGIIVLFIIYGSLYVFYDLVCEVFMNGQSIGKRVMKIRVISLDGTRPTISQFLLRWLFRIVDFTLTLDICALISAAVSENNQRVGDMVAGTTLIKTSPRTHMSSIAFMPANDGYQPVFKEAGQLTDQDVELIHEVINTYIKTGNSLVVYNMALRIKQHIGISPPDGMNDMRFLQTIAKDYNYISAQVDI